MVVITVAIAAPIYVYVSNMPKPSPPVAVMLNLKYNEATGELTISHIGGDIIEDALFTYSTNGLVGYWKMDEAGWDGTPDEVVDSSIEGNHGTAYGGASTTPNGKYGRAGSFDGVDDYIDLPKDEMTAGRSEATLEFWINADEWVSANTIWDEYSGTYWQNSIRCNYWYTRDSSTGSTGGRNNDLSLPTLTPGEWHHLVFVYSVSQNVKAIYLDGEPYASTSTSIDTLTSERQGACISYACDGDNFDGVIDEVRIYNRALSAEEIEANYHAGEWRNLEVKFNGQLFDINNVSCSSGSDIRAGSTLTITQSLNSGDKISIVYKPANQLLRQCTIP